VSITIIPGYYVLNTHSLRCADVSVLISLADWASSANRPPSRMRTRYKRKLSIQGRRYEPASEKKQVVAVSYSATLQPAYSGNMDDKDT
jgi:hypothetical protein